MMMMMMTFPLEFRGEVKCQETRVMVKVAWSYNSTVFDWSTRVTDR